MRPLPVAVLGETDSREIILLRLRGISRSWGARSVLASLDFDLAPGSVAWIGGPNGVGKTTLLRIAAGLITADAGEVALLGLSVDRDRREYQKRLGWLPAGNAGIYNRLSVRQNLTYWTSIALVARNRRRAAVDAAMEQFDLERLAGSRADRISMGERQRLRLAMTFAHDPRLVLMDEPHTSLDDAGLDLLGRALARLGASGGAAVWCSPSRDGVPLPANEAHLLEGGALVPC